MPAERILRIPKIQDGSLIRILSELRDAAPTSSTTLQLSGINVNFAESSQQSVLNRLRESKGYAISRAQHMTGSVGFEFRRSITVSNPNGGESQIPSPFFDEIDLRSRDAIEDALPLINLVNELTEKFGIGTIAPQISDSRSSEISDSLLQLINVTYQQTKDLNHEISASLLRDKVALEEDYLSRRKRLEDEIAEQRTELERKFQGRFEQLDVEAEQYRQKQKQLDDRANTHVRRELRKDLKDTILKRSRQFDLTPQTKRLRLPIHAACVVGLLVIGAAIYVFGHEVLTLAEAPNTSTSAITIVIVRQLGLTFGFLALLVYYIRWMNRWFDKHAEAEFQIKQFDLDIDRASWIVESGLEWSKEQHGPIPESLLKSLTTDLFSHSSHSPKDELHPADFLASALLGSASSVSLQVPGASIDYKGRQRVKKLMNTKVEKPTAE